MGFFEADQVCDEVKFFEPKTKHEATLAELLIKERYGFDAQWMVAGNNAMSWLKEFPGYFSIANEGGPIAMQMNFKTAFVSGRENKWSEINV